MTLTLLPLDTPKRLRAAGLNVVEVKGWQRRVRTKSSSAFGPVGVLNHHTGAFDRDGDLADDLAYATWMATVGRPDLSPSLTQFSLSHEGTVYLLARGRCNHAGDAKPSGSVAGGDGNRLYVGVEWMLSGTQPIPAKMYAAGATLNAVLLNILGSSVQAVSCHYQTSVTGKWDIGDPNGIRFGTAKVLDVPKFRRAVQAEKDRLNKPRKKVSETLVTYQHTSLQFSDKPAQQRHDAGVIFARGKDILSGTESAPDNANYEAVKAAAAEHGYWLTSSRGVWVAVRKTPERRFVSKGYVPCIESYEGAGKHSDRGIAWLTYEDSRYGRHTHGCGHYLTRGKKPGDPNYVLNRRMAGKIGEWAKVKGEGLALCTYSGDQNIVDRFEDTFFGSPLTSFWDELGKWENTGHGNIDLIASYDRDARLRARSIDARPDSEIPLFTDHFLIEGSALVRNLAA